MYPLMPLHFLASKRGEGLRPELVNLLTQRAAMSAAGVVDLYPRRVDGMDQAGPNPSGALEAMLPAKVARLVDRQAVS